jgi:hypothetical protein
MRKPTVRLATTGGAATPMEATGTKLKELARRLDMPNSFEKGKS